jgi:hypothetical protein
MPSVSPGDTFYDKLPDGRYEKCVLQKTDGSEPDRHAAARGGTGQFFRPMPAETLTPERMDGAEEMIYDLEEGKFVFLEPCAPPEAETEPEIQMPETD